MAAPAIENKINGFELPKIIGIGPMSNTPPVSICPSEPPRNDEKIEPITISAIPIKTTKNPNSTNLSKVMIQSYLNSS